MRVQTSRLTILAVAAALLAGCGGSGDKDSGANAAVPSEAEATPAAKVIQPGAPGEPSKEVEVTPTPEGVDYVAADVEFLQGMIHHHRQALEMTSMVDDRTQSTQIKLMAERMHVSQEDEITWMQRWLQNREIDPSGEHSAHEFQDMPGMLTAAELAALEAAKGKAFDRLFLKSMTKHHSGAIQMVNDLVLAKAGSESELNQFIMHIDSDQSIEIQRMAEISAKL